MDEYEEFVKLNGGSGRAIETYCHVMNSKGQWVLDKTKIVDAEFEIIEKENG